MSAASTSRIRRWLQALARPLPPQQQAAVDARRSYEAADVGRLAYGWNAGSAGPNSEVDSGRVVLRDRSRELVRNNALANRAVSVLTSALVGEGIRPQARTGRESLDAALMALWDMASGEIDAAGRCDVYGLQALAVRGWVESGESLLRRRWRRTDDPTTIPMQVQVLEADMLADDDVWSTGRRSGVRYGIETDAIGRRTAYELYRQHPGETDWLSASTLETVMVPASEVSHVYQVTRPGQMRGVPWLTPVMLDIRDLDDFEHAEIVRQKMQASLMAFRRTPSLDPLGISDQVEQATDGRWLETLSPGMIAKLPPGEDVTLLAPAQYGGFRDAVMHAQRVIATGAQIPYEILTGDLTGVNYSSIRAGMLEYRSLLRVLTRNVVIPHVCSPMWRWFVEAAEVGGLLPRMTQQERALAMRPHWHPPKWVPIDREAEIKADILEMQAGIRTLAETAAERGHDWMAQLEQMASEREKAEELGLSLSGFGSASPSQAVTMPPSAVSAPEVDDETDQTDDQTDDAA